MGRRGIFGGRPSFGGVLERICAPKVTVVGYAARAVRRQLKGLECGSALVSPLLSRHSPSSRPGLPTQPRRSPPRCSVRLSQNPMVAVPVIVLGEPGTSAVSVADAVTKSSSKPLKLKRLAIVPAVAVQLSWGDVMRLSAQPGLLSITEDAPMVSAGYSNPQRWPAVSGLAKLWTDVEKAGARPPAIAVVDTGVDATRTDFGGRVVSQVTLTTLPGNSTGDGSGHGTLVAGLAAGSAQLYAGAAPDRTDRLDRRRGRQGHVDDERRDRRRRLDPRQQGRQEHPRRQLLPPLLSRRLGRLRPACEGGRTALALWCRRRRRRGQLRRRTERRAASATPRRATRS